eukprot:scaffold15508_cov66-Cyclotella_meneghiniana.AAC.8
MEVFVGMAKENADEAKRILTSQEWTEEEYFGALVSAGLRNEDEMRLTYNGLEIPTNVIVRQFANGTKYQVAPVVNINSSYGFSTLRKITLTLSTTGTVVVGVNDHDMEVFMGMAKENADEAKRILESKEWESKEEYFGALARAGVRNEELPLSVREKVSTNARLRENEFMDSMKKNNGERSLIEKKMIRKGSDYRFSNDMIKYKDKWEEKFSTGNIFKDPKGNNCMGV